MPDYAVPVAARSKAWFCGLGLNPTGGGGYVCLSVVSVVCCAGRGLCDGLITRTEESYWLWWVCVWSRNLKKEEALAHWGGGLLRQKTNKCLIVVRWAETCSTVCKHWSAVFDCHTSFAVEQTHLPYAHRLHIYNPQTRPGSSATARDILTYFAKSTCWRPHFGSNPSLYNFISYRVT